MQRPEKHHFLPVFYLKQWANPDGKIVEFRKPYGPIVRPRRLHPEATGWVKRLYLAEKVHNEPAQDFETTFFSPVDSSAADALRNMLAEGTASTLTVKQRSAWANFVTSLLLRMPGDLNFIRVFLAQEFNKFRKYAELELEIQGIQHLVPDYKNLFDGLISEVIPSSTVKFIIKLINQPQFENEISRMKWLILNTDRAGFELLTSDRPVTISGTLNQHNSNFALAIGPRRIFVASHSAEMINLLGKVPVTPLVKKMNAEIVEGATALVCGRSEAQLSFVQSRMGSKTHNSILRRLPIFHADSEMALI